MTCTLLIIISWISFIIRPEIVTIQLVLINIFIGIKNKAPISSDLNAFDVFLVICIGHVFVACLEYAIVLVMMQTDGKISPLESSIQEYCFYSFCSFVKEAWFFVSFYSFWLVRFLFNIRKLQGKENVGELVLIWIEYHWCYFRLLIFLWCLFISLCIFILRNWIKLKLVPLK